MPFGINLIIMHRIIKNTLHIIRQHRCMIYLSITGYRGERVNKFLLYWLFIYFKTAETFFVPCVHSYRTYTWYNNATTSENFTGYAVACTFFVGVMLFKSWVHFYCNRQCVATRRYMVPTQLKWYAEACVHQPDSSPKCLTELFMGWTKFTHETKTLNWTKLSIQWGQNVVKPWSYFVIKIKTVCDTQCTFFLL